MKKCRACGKEFIPLNYRYFYCCDECKRKASIKQSAAWNKSNPDRMKDAQTRFCNEHDRSTERKEYQRTYYQRKKQIKSKNMTSGESHGD